MSKNSPEIRIRFSVAFRMDVDEIHAERFANKAVNNINFERLDKFYDEITATLSSKRNLTLLIKRKRVNGFRCLHRFKVSFWNRLKLIRYHWRSPKRLFAELFQVARYQIRFDDQNLDFTIAYYPSKLELKVLRCRCTPDIIRPG